MEFARFNILWNAGKPVPGWAHQQNVKLYGYSISYTLQPCLLNLAIKSYHLNDQNKKYHLAPPFFEGLCLVSRGKYSILARCCYDDHWTPYGTQDGGRDSQNCVNWQLVLEWQSLNVTIAILNHSYWKFCWAIFMLCTATFIFQNKVYNLWTLLHKIQLTIQIHKETPQGIVWW